MSRSEPQLDQIQRWMRAVLMHPDGVPAGVASPQAKTQIDVSADQLESVVARRGALSPAFLKDELKI